MAAIGVSIVRFLVPFSILRWPLAGAVAALLADALDIFFFQAFGYGFWAAPSYHAYDKVFDIWYLFFEFLVARRWPDPLVRRIAVGLFAWRFAGFVLFEITDWRGFFFLAPNIFEYFFLFWLIVPRLRSGSFDLTPRTAWIALLAIGIPSIVKEYLMHYREFQTWAFFRDTFFFWLF